LHATGRQPGLDFAPQYGRQLEADDAVKHAACLLCIYEVHIYGARLLDGVENGAFGDFVEHYASCGLGIEAQNFAQMPCYGLSFAVFIRCQPHGLCLLGGAAQLAYEILLVIRNFVDGLKTIVDIDAETMFFQVADMPVAGHDLIVVA